MMATDDASSAGSTVSPYFDAHQDSAPASALNSDQDLPTTQTDNNSSKGKGKGKRGPSVSPDRGTCIVSKRLRAPSPSGSPYDRNGDDGSQSHAGASANTNSIVALQLENRKLKLDLDFRNDLLRSQHRSIASIISELSCSICLNTMWRPFTISPCGHTFCVTCLVSWFQRPTEAEEDDLGPAESPQDVIDRTMRRKKVCPTCRTASVTPPTEAWLLKSMCNQVFNIASSTAAALDDEDISSDIKQINADLASKTSGQIAKERGLGLGSGDDIFKDIFDPNPLLPAIFDEADQLYRCSSCMSELWGQDCTNCGRHYSELDADGNVDSDAQSLGVSENDMVDHQGGLRGVIARLQGHIDGPSSNEDDEDSGSLRSFIVQDDDQSEDESGEESGSDDDPDGTGFGAIDVDAVCDGSEDDEEDWEELISEDDEDDEPNTTGYTHWSREGWGDEGSQSPIVPPSNWRVEDADPRDLATESRNLRNGGESDARARSDATSTRAEEGRRGESGRPEQTRPAHASRLAREEEEERNYRAWEERRRRERYDPRYFQREPHKHRDSSPRRSVWGHDNWRRERDPTADAYGREWYYEQAHESRDGRRYDYGYEDHYYRHGSRPHYEREGSSRSGFNDHSADEHAPYTVRHRHGGDRRDSNDRHRPLNQRHPSDRQHPSNHRPFSTTGAAGTRLKRRAIIVDSDEEEEMRNGPPSSRRSASLQVISGAESPMIAAGASGSGSGPAPAVAVEGETGTSPAIADADAAAAPVDTGSAFTEANGLAVGVERGTPPVMPTRPPKRSRGPRRLGRRKARRRAEAAAAAKLAAHKAVVAAREAGATSMVAGEGSVAAVPGETAADPVVLDEDDDDGTDDGGEEEEDKEDEEEGDIAMLAEDEE